MSTTVNIEDADTQLRELLDAVERGEEVNIERGGVICARLVPVPISRPMGFLKGKVPDSIFEPIMSDEELDEWENDDYTGPRYQPGSPGNI